MLSKQKEPPLLAHHRYQYCVIDPEGDHESFDNAIAFGPCRSGGGRSAGLKAAGLGSSSGMIGPTLAFIMSCALGRTTPGNLHDRGDGYEPNGTYNT